MKKQDKRNKSEQGNPALFEKKTRRRVHEFPWTPGSLPRDLHEWLHTERELKVDENSPTDTASY